MKDFLRRDVNVGDVVAYTARSGTSYQLKLYVISEIRARRASTYTDVKLYGVSKGMKYGPYDSKTRKFAWIKKDVITGYTRWCVHPDRIILINAANLDVSDPIHAHLLKKHYELISQNVINNPPI